MNATVRYRQLADQLETAIKQGTLGASSKLPSVRACASQQGVSLNTVTAAYRLLEDRGLIEARPKSGYFVRSSLPLVEHALRQRPAQPDVPRQDDLMARILQCQQSGDYVDLALACPRDEPFYPTTRLARVTASVLRQRPELVSRYALPPGSLKLRTRIARRALQLGMQLAPEDLLLTHGAMEAIQLAMRAVTRPGMTVGVESPTYYNLYPMLASLGLKVLEIPTHPQQGLALDALELLLQEQRLDALVVMPSIHNPLGCSMPVAARQRLAAQVNQYRIPMVEDLVYAELQFAAPLLPAVKSFDKDGWVMVCGSYTKTLAPDYRIGWVDGGRFRAEVSRLKFSASVAESELFAESIARFLDSGGYDHHLRTIRQQYSLQVSAVRGLVARYFPAGTRATLPVGGFLLWVELPDEINTLELFEAALAERMIFIPGQLYSNGARYRHCLRLSCCHELDARHMAALQRLGELACQMNGVS